MGRSIVSPLGEASSKGAMALSVQNFFLNFGIRNVTSMGEEWGWKRKGSAPSQPTREFEGAS